METTKELAAAAKRSVRVPAVSVHRPEEGGNFLAVIAAAAADPRCSVEKMQALLNMQIQVEEREAKKDFARAFMALQAELPAISRDGRIEIREKDQRTGSREHGRVQQSTPYATFNNIMKVIKGLLTKHGFALSFSTEPAGERLLVKGLLEGYGHHRETSFPLPAETSGSKNNVQGWGSSMSYGKRYCTIALLNIISEAPDDADADGHSGKFARAKDGGMVETAEVRNISKAEAEELLLLIEDAKIKESQFCTHYGIAKPAELPANLFEAAKKEIAAHKAKRNG